MSKSAILGNEEANLLGKAVQNTVEFVKDVSQVESLVENIKSLFAIPGLASAQVIFGQIAAGTANSSMELLDSLLEKLKDPAVQTAINGIIAGINGLNEALIWLIENGNKFIQWLKRFGGGNNQIKEQIKNLDVSEAENTTNTFITLLTNLKTSIDAVK
jgi:hypothetical protein